MTMRARTYVGVWLAAFVVLIILLLVFRDILLPFVVGMAVAYFLDPVADRLERAGFSRTLVTTLITITFVIVVGLLLFFLVPVLQSQAVDFLKNLPDFFQSARGWAEPLIERWVSTMDPDRVQRAETVIEDFSGRAVQFVLGIVGNVWAGGMALVNFLALAFITPVVTFYMLRDWDSIVDRVRLWLPREQAPAICEQAKLMDSTLAGFVRGTGIVCLILAAFYGGALSAAGLQFGLAIGIAAGLLSFVPYLGSIGGLIICVGLAILQFDEMWRIGVTAGIFVIGQVAGDYVLTPRLVGQRVRLHPVWIIFAVLAGGTLFGFVGMLISVPFAALIGVLARFGIGSYLESDMYDGTVSSGASDSTRNEPPEGGRQ